MKPRAALPIALAITLAPAFASVLSPRAAAAGASHLTVQDIFREPRIEGTRPQSQVLSPDERWVAFTWNPDGLDAPLDLWVVPAAGGEPRALTRFKTPAPRAVPPLVGERSGSEGAALGDSLAARIRDYFKSESRARVEALDWSPDSRRIAFLKGGDVYVAALGGERLERLTRTSAPESEPRWSPDGRGLAFVRDGAVWLLQIDRPREIQLVPAGGDSAAPSSLQWSPDGSRLAFVTRDERGLSDLLIPSWLGPRVETSRVKEGLPDTGLHLVDLEAVLDGACIEAQQSDEPLRVVRVQLGPGKHPDLDAFAWSPDSRRLVVSEVLPDMRRRRLHVARADSGSARSVYSEADSAWIGDHDWVIADRPALEWSPDGRWILFLSERSGFAHLWRVPADGGTPEALTEGAWEVGWAHGLPDGRHVVLLGNRARTSERHLELLDVERRTLEPLATFPGMNIHPSMVRGGGVVLYEQSRFAEPPELCTIAPRAGARPTTLTRTVPDRFRAVPWVVPEIVEFPARDGTRLHGLLYRPQPFDPARRYPVVVFVHGAGSLQNVVDGWTIYAPNFEFHTVLAQKGYAVFEVDYRGSLGYGRDFRTGVHGHLGGKDLDDELAGVDWLQTFAWVDAGRIGIYGGSYGGFLTLMALFQAPRTYACGAALRFVADWANYYRSNPGYCLQRLGTPGKNPVAYYRSSPIHFAEALQDPLLLLHGMRDDNVHFQDAAQLTERLIRLGKKFDLMVYPSEAHGFTASESWIDEYRRIEDFFDRNLQPGSAAPAAAGTGVTSSPRQ